MTRFFNITTLFTEKKKESFINLFLLKFKNLLDDYIGNYFIKYLFFLLFISFFILEISFSFFYICNTFVLNNIVVDFNNFYFYNSVLSSFLFDFFNLLFNNFFFSILFTFFSLFIYSIYFNTSFIIFLIPFFFFIFKFFRSLNMIDLIICGFIFFFTLINPFFFFILLLIYYVEISNEIKKISFFLFFEKKDILYSFLLTSIIYIFCILKYASFISFYSFYNGMFIFFIFAFVLCLETIIRNLNK